MRFWFGCVVALVLVCLAWADVADDADLLRQERLIGNIITSTTTVLTITTVSTEVPVSCLVNVLPAVACTGRRRRRSAAPSVPLELSAQTGVEPTRLYGSMAQESHDSLTAGGSGTVTRQVEVAAHKARLFLFATRFITVDNLITWYTTSTNESTTVSFSLACTAAGQNLLTRRCVSP